MKRIATILLFSGCVSAFGQLPPLPPGYVFIPPTVPELAITVADEPGVVVQPESASLPLTVGRSNRWYTATGCAVTMTGAAWRPVLRLEITVPSNTVAEIEYSTNSTTWTKTNIRLVSYGEPIRWHIPQPVGTRFYRLRLT